MGPHTWTTCGEYAPTWCTGIDDESSEPTASVTADDACKADEASQVRSEEATASSTES